MFNGFAFVQYSSPTEADPAVSALNQYNWQGNVLDVKVQISHLVEASAAKKEAAQAGTVYPNVEDDGAKVKKGKFQHAPTTQGMSSGSSDIKGEIADLFICGNCHYTKSGLEAFVEHRRLPCNKAVVAKQDNEPEKFRCCSCEEDIVACWDLLDHLSKIHTLTVYKDIKMDEQ